LKARLAFLVERWFSREIFMQLVEKGFSKIGEKTWVVPLERIKEFEKITGLTIEASEGDIEKLLNMGRSEKPVPVVAVTARKRKSGEKLEVVVGTSGEYHVTLSTSGRVFTIPSEILAAYYDVINGLKAKGMRVIKKRDLVAIVMERLGVTSYFTGRRFHWEAFYGDRTRYHTHYYVPAKMLEAKGLIKVTQHDNILIL